MKHRYYRQIPKFIFLVAGFLSGHPLIAQDVDFLVRIKQPATNTVYGCSGERIVFMAEGQNFDGSAFDPNQAIFSWDFGDGTPPRTGPSIMHSFEHGGHFRVRLIVTGSNGRPASNEPGLDVFISLRPYFTDTRSDRTSICMDQDINLSGEVLPVEWKGETDGFVNVFDLADQVWSGLGLLSNRNGVARIRPPLNLGHLRYKFTVRDDFGCFHDTTLLLYGLHTDYTMDPKEGEAPLEVVFTPDSVSNGGFEDAVRYSWEFYEVTDTTRLLYSSEPTFVFERPGQYLTRVNATYEKCTYQFVHPDYIRVDSSLLEIPNVFTPNEDGANDFFQVKSRSLKYFNGKIFNRWGKLVFEWSDWTTPEAGWNGLYQNTGTPAPSGTYYYIIIADGYDDVIYKGKEYKGFLTLMR